MGHGIDASLTGLTGKAMMQPEKPDVRQVFIVGTGRCGTTTLANLLSQIPGCCVRHEHAPVLLREVSDYLRGTLSERNMTALLVKTRSAVRIGGDVLSGEANQRLSYVLPCLARAFPKATYLWLVRDGRETVSSLYFRGWYQPRERIALTDPNSWPANRIRGDAVGAMGATEWTRLHPFGKCCWYWAYTNLLIERELQLLPVTSRMIRLEDLSREQPLLVKFLGLHATAPNRIPRLNTATGHRRLGYLPKKPLHWSTWSRKQWDLFQEYAGPVMDRLYSAWRDQVPQNRRDKLHGLVLRTSRTMYDAAYEFAATMGRPIRRRLRAPSRPERS